MIDLDKYKAVIFDWDGTLVDTCGILLEAHNHVRTSFEEPLWTMEEYMAKPSFSAREFFKMIYDGRAEEAEIIFYEFIEEKHLEFLKPMNGVVEFFELTDLPLGVVSNKRHPTLNIEVDKMEWRPQFKSIIGAGQAKKDKPAPDPLLMAINEIDENIQGSDILYVGDTETDLLTGKAVGADLVFIQSDRPRPDLIEKHIPSYVFDDLKSFVDAVTLGNSTPNKQAV